MAEPDWTIDAAGEWALDRSHVPGGATPIIQEVMRRSMPAGMRRVFAELGVPAETLDVRFLHGWFYSRLRPLVSPDDPPARLPPRPVLKVLTRLHPEMRRRARTAERVLREAPWQQVVRTWREGGRARVEAKNLLLQDVELGRLDDVGLVHHVRRCVEHCTAQWEHHFWLHGFDLGPIGQYLHESAEWGLTTAELLPLLRGASPSTSAPARRLRGIRDALEAAGATPTTLDEARAVSPEIGAAIDQHLRHRGSLLFSSYDLDGVTLAERPDLVLQSILHAPAPDDDDARVELAIRAVRERLLAEHRDRFDVILGQARAAMDLRDDNGPTTAEWPLGLVRLSLLEVGRRLAAGGLVEVPEHALELAAAEVIPALFAGGGPTAEELSARAERRRWERSLEPPRTIGTREPAPPLDVLPASLARMVGMVNTVMAELGMDGAELAAPEAGVLRGSGIGTATLRARACVASTAEEALDLLEPGDVLVVPCTTPAYNLVLTIAGGVVTAEGGPMSHAAVLARELGIPAVVGVGGALTGIRHGSEIELDAAAGTVRSLTPAPVSA